MTEERKVPIRPTTTATARKAAALNELEGKTIVSKVTTEEYIKPNEETKTANNGINNNLSFTANGAAYSNPFNTQNDLSETKEMRVIRELTEYADDNPDYVFMAIVTRKADSMNDNIKYKTYTDLTFPPLMFTVKEIFNFPSILFKANNFGGGKFNLVICDAETGQAITKYFIAVGDNLLPKEDATPENSNNNNSLVTVFEKMLQAQNQQTERILQAINQANNKPQEKSVLEKAIEAKLLKEITEDKPPAPANDFNAMRGIYNNEMFQIKMIERMFRDDITPEQNQSFLEKILSNEQLVASTLDKVGLIASNAMQLLAMRSMQNNQPVAPITTAPQTPVINNPTLPDLSPEQNESMQKQQQLFNIITSELERLDAENLPVTADNPVLIKLSEDYADIYPLIVMTAKSSEFASVWDILTNQVLSDELKEKYIDVDGDLTENGTKIKRKVKELFDLWKNS